MAATQNISIRVDSVVKAKAEEILAELGLPTATAVNIFLKSVIRHNGLPFDMTLERRLSNRQVLERAQSEFRGAAEELGIKSDEDIMSLVREVRYGAQ